MADSAESPARNAGNPHDEEERPDIDAIEAMLRAVIPGEWRADIHRLIVVSQAKGLDVLWMAPDMEGHPDAVRTLELVAQAPGLLRALTAEVRRLRSLAGITE